MSDPEPPASKRGKAKRGKESSGERDRFVALTKKLLSVPKKDIDGAREAERRRRTA